MGRSGRTFQAVLSPAYRPQPVLGLVPGAPVSLACTEAARGAPGPCPDCGGRGSGRGGCCETPGGPLPAKTSREKNVQKTLYLLPFLRLERVVATARSGGQLGAGRDLYIRVRGAPGSSPASLPPHPPCFRLPRGGEGFFDLLLPQIFPEQRVSAAEIRGPPAEGVGDGGI